MIIKNKIKIILYKIIKMILKSKILRNLLLKKKLFNLKTIYNNYKIKRKKLSIFTKYLYSIHREKKKFSKELFINTVLIKMRILTNK